MRPGMGRNWRLVYPRKGPKDKAKFRTFPFNFGLRIIGEGSEKLFSFSEMLIN